MNNVKTPRLRCCISCQFCEPIDSNLTRGFCHYDNPQKVVDIRVKRRCINHKLSTED